MTRNKLPYLKDRLGKLLTEKKDDEEILVADGQSTDGTKEYLEKLKDEGKISYLISEPDFGIAHALNKLALKATGTLIKFITDDDVFHYPTIEKCTNFMINHPEIDVILTNGGTKDQDTSKSVRPLMYHPSYEKWLVDQTPFTATDLGIIVRRSSIPLIGLWNTSFPAPDAEFVFRLMTSKANIAWNTGFSFVNVSNKKSVSLSSMRQIKKDMDRLNKYYLNKNPDSFIIEKLKVIRNKLRDGSLFKEKNIQKKAEPNGDWEQWLKLIDITEKWLDQKYKENKSTFLWNKHEGTT